MAILKSNKSLKEAKAPDVIKEVPKEIVKEVPVVVDVPKVAPKPVIGEKGFLLKKAFTKDLRDGMILSMDKYNELKSRGVEVDFYL